MKLLSKEEEQAHYKETLKGGITGGIAGLTVGLVGVYAATARYPAFRHITLPLKAFLISSSATFAAIILADRSSRSFEAARHPGDGYKDASSRAQALLAAQRTPYEKFMYWGRENRYPIVGAAWVSSMAIALGLVGRSPYLSTSQKIVQARVYAQGLTLAVLIATAAFEIGDRKEEKGRWETVKIIDPHDPAHKHLIEKKVHHERYSGEDLWRDMVEVEERKIKEREEAAHEEEERHRKVGKIKHKKEGHYELSERNEEGHHELSEKKSKRGSDDEEEKKEGRNK